jgi:hypothetical protein
VLRPPYAAGRIGSGALVGFFGVVLPRSEQPPDLLVEGPAGVDTDRPRHADYRADPIFAKLDPSVVHGELLRLEARE